MKPTNEKERNRLFLQFTLYFASAVAVVAIALFYDVNLPQKENDLLRETLNSYRAENAREAGLHKRFEEMRGQLTNLKDMKKTQLTDISSGLRELEADIRKDSVSKSGFYLGELAMYRSFLGTKEIQIEAEKEAESMKSKLQEAKELQKETDGMMRQMQQAQQMFPR